MSHLSFKDQGKRKVYSTCWPIDQHSLSYLQCTEKMKVYIPGRCHDYGGDKKTGQGGIGNKLLLWHELKYLTII